MRLKGFSYPFFYISCIGNTLFHNYIGVHIFSKPDFYFPNGRYIDCLSLTYATNKSKTLRLQYTYLLTYSMVQSPS